MPSYRFESRGFFDDEKLLPGDIGQFLGDAGRPLDPDDLDVGGAAQTEMGIKSILTGVATATGNFAQLPPCLPCYRCFDSNLGPDG